MILEKAKNKIGQLVYCSLAGETEKPIISSWEGPAGSVLDSGGLAERVCPPADCIICFFLAAEGRKSNNVLVFEYAVTMMVGSENMELLYVLERLRDFPTIH